MEAWTDFTRGSPLLASALEFARCAHRSPEADGAPLDHPVRVARILHASGYADEVVAAGLLHDVVEDTPEELEDIARRFGQPVAGLVSALTEDGTIEPYEARKAEHRRRVCDAGHEAAAVFAADKLAKVRELEAEGSAVEPAKLEHYCRSLEMVRSAHPEVPFLEDLERELAAYRFAHPATEAPGRDSA